jgi:hypothetical protein
LKGEFGNDDKVRFKVEKTFGGHTEENMLVKKKVGCWYGNKVEYANLKPATRGLCGKYEAVLVGSWTLCYVTGYCERLIIVGIIVR